MDNRERVARELERLATSLTKQDDEFKMKLFARDLAKLSKKYGIAVQSVGGVSFGEISSISYSSDPTSGDLIPRVSWKN